MESVIGTVLIGVLCFVGYIYFTHYKEMERLKNDLESKVKQLKTKVVYLQNYKDDVSRTFKILDNELMMIKDNISKQQPIDNGELNVDTNRVSILTPSILSALMSNDFMRDINQEQSSSPDESNLVNRMMTTLLDDVPEQSTLS